MSRAAVQLADALRAEGGLLAAALRSDDVGGVPDEPLLESVPSSPYAMTPSAQTSEAVWTSSPRSWAGAIYLSVPMTSLVSMTMSLASLRALATPKSTTFEVAGPPCGGVTSERSPV